MQISGPLALALGVGVDVPPPPASTEPVAVVLANASPFACSVTIGGNQQWLQAWTADLYPLPPGAAPRVVPQFTTDLTGLVTAGNLTASWYSPTDNAGGVYPAPLSAQAVAATVGAQQASNSVLVNTSAAPVGAATTLTLGPFYVGNSNALSLMVQDQALGGDQIIFNFYWCAGPSLAQQVALISYFKTNGVQLNDLLPVIAPYLIVTVHNPLGAASTYSAFVARAGSAIGFPGGVLDRGIASVDQSVAAGATVFGAPLQQIPGLAVLGGAMSANTGPGQFVVQAFNTGLGAYQNIGGFSLPAAGGNDAITVALPNSDVRVAMVNQNAAAQSMQGWLISAR